MNLQPGMQIGRYKVLERVGAGSSGEIWKALDGTRTVAIKFIHAELLTSTSSEKHRTRLEREIRALQILNHPNIPALYDYDLHFQRPYIVMEYVDSVSLDSVLLNGSIMRYPLAQRMKVIHQIASALQLAHKHGIIHRDIKPGNINGLDKPYLMDFGIALQEHASRKTNVNIGTTIYMAPEFEPPNMLSDAWSFAVVAYELIFGFHPIFNYDDPLITQGMAARFETKNRLDSGQWRKPTRLANRLHESLGNVNLTRLERVFTRALGKPEERYHDLVVFADDIERALNLDGSEQDDASISVEIPLSAGGNRAVQEIAMFTQLEVEQATRNKRMIAVGAAVIAAIVMVIVVLMLLKM